MNRSRSKIPPLRYCPDPLCGHEWRGWSQSCPKCAGTRVTGETLREYRKRTIDPERNAR